MEVAMRKKEEGNTEKGKLKDKDKKGDNVLFPPTVYYNYYSLNHRTSIHTNRQIISWQLANVLPYV